MNTLFCVLCVTFFLSLFILKFRWFKKIGEWIAKPFIKFMKKRRLEKKNKQAVSSKKSDRLGKSEFQVRPVVLPPQLNAPQEEQDKKETPKENVEQDEKPMTMKDVFGDKRQFETKPAFPMAQENCVKENQSYSNFGTRYSQNLANNSVKKQNKISLDFLNSTTKNVPSTSFNQQEMAYIKSGETFDKQNLSTNSKRNSSYVRSSEPSFGKSGKSYGFSFNDEKHRINTQNFGGQNAIRRMSDMDAIISKRQYEFENYKKQADSLKLDGQEVDMTGLPPKLKRILVMGILDKKNYD